MKKFFKFAVPLALWLALCPVHHALCEPTPCPEGPIELVYSRMIDVPGVGEWPYYAQNDPLWGDAIYEPIKSTNWRVFRWAGCGPTAAAIAISRHVAPERLNELLNFKSPYAEEYSFCTCSVNGFRCDRTHELSTLVTSEDFETYLPIAFGIFATGNNSTRTKYRTEASGTLLSIFPALAEAYQLEYAGSRYWEDALDALNKGFSVITTVSKGAFTTDSHYLVLAHVDDEWIYVLDPYMRESYAEMDTKGILEIVEPGLVRAKVSDFSHLGFSGYYMFNAPKPYQNTSLMASN
ncbi:MAG: C39 family peptidase [Clostridia bacterium]|nr:C39 family peptidase [Clostridia bacterium]